MNSNSSIESYLSDIKDYKLRTQLTKLRLSNHTLLIETGRHKKIPKEMRVCPFCPNSVEDELHFILQCPTYTILRDKILTNLGEINPLLNLCSQEEKFKYIMRNINRDIALFVTNCFNLRACLVSQNGGDWVVMKFTGYILWASLQLDLPYLFALCRLTKADCEYYMYNV